MYKHIHLNSTNLCIKATQSRIQGIKEVIIMFSLALSLLCFIGADGLPSARINNEEPLTISPNLIPKSLEATSAPLTISQNLILNRAINTCECAKATSSDRIVGGKEVTPKYKLPYQVLFQVHKTKL